MRELSPIPDFFTPPKGRRGSDLTMSLMAMVPASRRAANRVALFDISAPDGCSEAVLRVVCDPDGLVFILHNDDWCNRAENLFGQDFISFVGLYTAQGNKEKDPG